MCKICWALSLSSNTNPLHSLQKNQERPVLTLVTLWTPVGQVMTINLDLRFPTTVTMATQPWVGKPSPVSWGMMGNQCGTGLCHHVKVGDLHQELPPYKHIHHDDGKIMVVNTCLCYTIKKQLARIHIVYQSFTVKTEYLQAGNQMVKVHSI